MLSIGFPCCWCRLYSYWRTPSLSAKAINYFVYVIPGCVSAPHHWYLSLFMLGQLNLILTPVAPYQADSILDDIDKGVLLLTLASQSWDLFLELVLVCNAGHNNLSTCSLLVSVC